MMPLVVDASAALAYLLCEPGEEQVRREIQGRDDMLVPGLFWSEVINALARRHRWPAAKVLSAVYDLEQLGLHSERSSRATMLAVIDAVESHSLTAYDAEYLVLAEAADAELLTGDADLAAAAGRRAIFIGTGHKLGEHSERYAAGPPPEGAEWTRWPGAIAYLDELRREARSDLTTVRSNKP